MICKCCGQPLPISRAYVLLKPIPGLPAGVVFIHDTADSVRGSVAVGCLKLAWDHGSCQRGWCAETHVFPGQLAEDREWFLPIPNDDGRFHLSTKSGSQ